MGTGDMTFPVSSPHCLSPVPRTVRTLDGQVNDSGRQSLELCTVTRQVRVVAGVKGELLRVLQGGRAGVLGKLTGCRSTTGGVR